MLNQSSTVNSAKSRRGFSYEFFKGSLRLLFLIVFSLFFAAMCAGWLEKIPVWENAEQLKQNAHYLFSWIPVWIWVFRVPFQGWETARYLLVPLSAFLMVFTCSVSYVRDIYHLPSLGRALHYVFASLFGFFYPVAYVDGGKINDEDPDNETNIEDKNLLRAIGGPGFVRIQPGNAVAFRDWQSTQGISTQGLYFLRPFEMIARVVSLEDQHGHLDEVTATTSDGIRLRLKNIDYRFCVLRPGPPPQDVSVVRRGERRLASPRNPDLPYPYSEEAISEIAYSFPVGEKGMDRWADVVGRAMGGALGSFIGRHDLDFLTAPRQDGQNPRRELRVELLAPAVSESFRKAGAELHWMDIGHFDMIDLVEDQSQNPVDQARTRFWAARWVGDANTVRSYGEARHLVYQELARAEAQAEMIMSITDALRDVTFGPNRADTLRQIFLARTAQILEALQNGRNGKEPRA